MALIPNSEYDITVADIDAAAELDTIAKRKAKTGQPASPKS